MSEPRDAGEVGGECCRGSDPHCAGGCLVEQSARQRTDERDTLKADRDSLWTELVRINIERNAFRDERERLKGAVEQARNLENAASVVENVLRGYVVDQREDVPERKALALADALRAALTSAPAVKAHAAGCNHWALRPDEPCACGLTPGPTALLARPGEPAADITEAVQGLTDRVAELEAAIRELIAYGVEPHIQRGLEKLLTPRWR